MLSAVLMFPALWAKQPMCAAQGASRGADASADRLRAHVEGLVALSPRDTENAHGTRAAIELVLQAFRDAGLQPELQPFAVEGEAEPAHNVVARVGPESGPRIVVGAHYDACGPYPGADDNASGVPALLELARLLGEQPPASTVELVAYANEEPPHYAKPSMGSAHHARALVEAGVTVKAMIALEMVGYFTDAAGSRDPRRRLLGSP